MKRSKVLNTGSGRGVVLIEVVESEARPHDYGISRAAWVRGLRIMNSLGVENALRTIDQRAMRAVDRGDPETARRWRDLIVAIHAITEEERLPGDGMH